MFDSSEMFLGISKASEIPEKISDASEIPKKISDASEIFSKYFWLSLIFFYINDGQISPGSDKICFFKLIEW